MNIVESNIGLPTRFAITGVVLAGGRGRRMGGEDKGLVLMNGRCMVEHVIECLQPQVKTVLVSINRNHERYAAFGHRTISDALTGFQGPLAGIATAMQTTTTPYIATVPCDSPLIGTDLVARLSAALTPERSDICVAHDGARPHPVFALMKRSLLSSLLDFLQAGERRLQQWLANHRTVHADFSDRPEYFINVNDRIEHQAVETRLRRVGSC